MNLKQMDPTHVATPPRSISTLHQHQSMVVPTVPVAVLPTNPKFPTSGEAVFKPPVHRPAAIQNPVYITKKYPIVPRSVARVVEGMPRYPNQVNHPPLAVERALQGRALVGFHHPPIIRPEGRRADIESESTQSPIGSSAIKRSKVAIQRLRIHVHIHMSSSAKLMGEPVSSYIKRDLNNPSGEPWSTNEEAIALEVSTDPLVAETEQPPQHVASAVIVNELDELRTATGSFLTKRREELMRRYIVGRVSGRDIRDATGAMLIQKHELITEDTVRRVQDAGKVPELIVYMKPQRAFQENEDDTKSPEE